MTVLVPDAVLEELGGLRPEDPAEVAVRSAPWIEVVAVPALPDSLGRFRLDPGESAVIALELLPTEQETEVVLDDLAARRTATAMGIKVRGSLSFLLIAKAKGRIPLVGPLIDELRQGGMRHFPRTLSAMSSTLPVSDNLWDGPAYPTDAKS